MDDMDRERWEEVDARLKRIEAFLAALGMPTPPAAPPQPVRPPPLPPVVPQPAPPIAQVVSPQIIEMPDERGARVHREVFVEENRFGEIVQPSEEAQPSTAKPVPPQDHETEILTPSYESAAGQARQNPPNRVPSTDSPPNVEQTIGLKLAGWIGAIVLVIGAAMGVKFAYDQGWLGGLPDEVKLGLYYAVGIALIGAGEYVYRRVNDVAAVGLYAAGVAGLFVVSYAGNAYYQLYEQSAAFALMAGSCAIGALISLRGGLVSIAVLSLLGANVAPLILRNRTVGEWPLLIYLLVLQVLALGLAHIGKGARWWILRNFALATLSLWMAGRLMSPTAFSAPTVVCLCLSFVLFQIENALAARRADNSRFSHPTFSFAVTAAFTVALLRWSMPLSDMSRGSIVVLLSFIAFTAGAAFLNARNDRLRPLGQSYLVQGGILLFAAVPVALSGPWIFVAWACMALGYVVLGAVFQRLRTASAGVLIWCAAVAVLSIRMVISDPVDVLRTESFAIGGQSFPVYFVIVMLIALIGSAIALILDRRLLSTEKAVKELGAVPSIVAITAALIAAVVCVAALQTNATTLAIVILGWFCFVLAYFAASTAGVLRFLAGAAVTLALGHWVAMLAVAHSEQGANAIAGTLVFNSRIGLGALCVGSLLAMARLLPPRLESAKTAPSLVTLIALVVCAFAVCFGLSFEIERAVEQGGPSAAWPSSQLTAFGCTALWAIVTAALPWLGGLLGISKPDREPLGRLSTVGLSLIAAKFVLIDSLVHVMRREFADPTKFFNAQTGVMVLLVALLIFRVRTSLHVSSKNVARAMIFLLPLVIGSIELSRLVGREKTLMAFSVYWGLYAIVSIGIGFAVRAAVLRYAGLGLLGIALIKVVLIDLAGAGTGWRILSFLGVGSILLATSVLYGKLSPLLLRNAKQDPSTSAEV